MSRFLASFFLATLIAATLTPANANGQAASTPSATANATADDTKRYEKDIQDLQEKLARMDERIAAAEQAAANQTEAQLGIPPELVTQKIQYLRRLKRCYSEHVRHLLALDTVGQNQRDVAQESGAFTGFPDPPPYSIAALDALHAELDEKQADLDAQTREAERIKQTLDLLQSDNDQADRDQRQATRDVAANSDAAQTPRLQWLVGLAQIRLQMTTAAVDEARAKQQLAEETASLRRQEATFAKQKISIILRPGNLLFGPNELKAKLADIETRRKDLRVALEDARNKGDRKQDALAATTRSVEASGDPAARVTLALPKAQADAAQTVISTLEMQLDSLDNEAELWRIRQAVAIGQIPRGSRDKIAAILKGIDLFAPSLKSELDVVQSQAARAEQVPGVQDIAPFSQYQGIQTVLQLRETTLQHAIDRLTLVRTLAMHVRDEIDARTPPEPWQERIARYRANMQGVWDYELFVLGGNKMSVGKIVVVLLILGIGMLLSRRIARAANGLAVRRFRADENVASTMEKMLYYGLMALVVLVALSAAQIPLTVFTLFGGALAIGVGFGAQNLINNFISGLILLFERPIKIGDIVEVDGQSGRIMNIGARCSQLRLFNGVDILVPNSVFLEKNVVNWTLAEPIRRFSIVVGVSYGSPIEKVREVILDATERQEPVLKQPAPLVAFKDFGDSALVFEVYYWLPLDGTTDSRVVATSIRTDIVRLFAEAGITFPFPQRDMNLSARSPLQVTLLHNVPESGTGAEDHPQ